MPAKNYKEEPRAGINWEDSHSRTGWAPQRLARSTHDHYYFYCVDTLGFAPLHRLDIWRDTVVRVADLAHSCNHGHSYRGRVTWVSGISGKFCSYAGLAHRVRIGPMSGEWFTFMLLQEGSVELRGKNGPVIRLTAGSLVMINPIEGEFHWSDSREVHLMLPRDLVAQAMGADIELLEFAVLLDDNPLASFVRSQLILLDREAGSLSRFELASMLDITIEMALALLHGMACCGPVVGSGFQSALFSSAQRFIETHAYKPDFNAAVLASALGCSRAKLYRVFAGQGTTVNAMLRNIRLERARRLIEGSAAGDHIGALAYTCGFSDHSSFGRMFKEHYGLPPGEWRQRQKEANSKAAAQVDGPSDCQRRA